MWDVAIEIVKQRINDGYAKLIQIAEVEIDILQFLEKHPMLVLIFGVSFIIIVILIRLYMKLFR